jgi:phage shock protein PspC (stress-responsive transcriptional regulator)
MVRTLVAAQAGGMDTDTDTDTTLQPPTDTDSDSDTDRPSLGTATGDPLGRPRTGDDRLSRGGDGRMVAGVALGLADYFDIDPTLVRIGFMVLGLIGGLAVPLYVAGWLLIPDEDADLSVAEEMLARERDRDRGSLR